MKTKKLIALLLCLALALSMLAGCGSNNNAAPANNTNTENSANSGNTVPVPAGPTEEEMTKLNDITKAGAKTVAADKLKEGSYDIKVASGSSLFKILESKLVVVGGVMQLVLKVEGDAYSKMYAGDAASATSAATVAEGEKDADGNTTFRLVVKSLNEVLTCSAYADASGKWYDRTILADSDSLSADAFKPVKTADNTPRKDDTPKKDDTQKQDDTPKEDPKPDDTPKEDPKPDDTPKDDPTPNDPTPGDPTPDDPTPGDPDPDDPTPDDPDPDEPTPDDPPQGLTAGDYAVNVGFNGGSGRTALGSTGTLHVSDSGSMTVTVSWHKTSGSGTTSYAWMKVGGTKYYPDYGQTFTVPVSELDTWIGFSALTEAMSEAHEIEYSMKISLQ